MPQNLRRSIRLLNYLPVAIATGFGNSNYQGSPQRFFLQLTFFAASSRQQNPKNLNSNGLFLLTTGIAQIRKGRVYRLVKR